jgi:CRP-like cAMP-binding protein
MNALLPLGNEDLTMVFGKMKRLDIPVASNLLEINDIADKVYFIEKGVLRTYSVDKKGNKQVFNLLFEGDFVTDYGSFITQKPSRYCIESLEPCQLLYYTYEDRNAFVEASPQLQKISRLIIEKFYLELKDRYEYSVLLSPEERYKKLLFERPEIFQRIALNHIAEYINIRPQSLSRIRKRLSHVYTKA